MYAIAFLFGCFAAVGVLAVYNFLEEWVKIIYKDNRRKNKFRRRGGVVNCRIRRVS